MTPRTSMPADRASSAIRPASAGSHPQRGRPTLTSTSTSRTPPAAAASTVSGESTATVMRAPVSSATAPRRVQSSTSLARRRSSPRPARAIPSISRTVAQQNVRCPAAASSRASAVDLKAFTCGRRRAPGCAAAIVATLWSKAPRSTTSAGVGTSPSFTGRNLTPSGSAPVGPPCSCRRWDSNPHCTGPKPVASAVGLRRRCRAGRVYGQVMRRAWCGSDGLHRYPLAP